MATLVPAATCRRCRIRVATGQRMKCIAGRMQPPFTTGCQACVVTAVLIAAPTYVEDRTSEIDKIFSWVTGR